MAVAMAMATGHLAGSANAQCLSHFDLLCDHSSSRHTPLSQTSTHTLQDIEHIHILSQTYAPPRNTFTDFQRHAQAHALISQHIYSFRQLFSKTEPPYPIPDVICQNHMAEVFHVLTLHIFSGIVYPKQNVPILYPYIICEGEHLVGEGLRLLDTREICTFMHICSNCRVIADGLKSTGCCCCCWALLDTCKMACAQILT